ncbi:putative single-stranded DNA binding protein [Bacillus phage SWEP1]|nr:putative single-stranded DNA binding protein [Bacillus phage SWEP1]
MAHVAFLIFSFLFIFGGIVVGDMIERPYKYDIIQFAIVFTCFIISMFYIVGYIEYMFIQ